MTETSRLTIDDSSSCIAHRASTNVAEEGRHVVESSARQSVSARPHRTWMSEMTGGDMSMTNVVLDDTVCPTLLVAPTVTWYVLACSRRKRASCGKVMLVSVLLSCAYQRAWDPSGLPMDTLYSITPAHVAAKPDQRTTLERRSLTTAIGSPNLSASATDPWRESSAQHRTAPSDATSVASPAQLVARTAANMVAPQGSTSPPPCQERLPPTLAYGRSWQP